MTTNTSGFNATNVRINAAMMYSFDGSREKSIADLITAYEFQQSIEMGSYRGSIRILDTTNTLEEFPIRGEERIILSLEAGNRLTSKTLDLHVYRVDNIIPTEAGDGVSFVLHFVSYTTFAASRNRIVASYQRDSASRVAQQIFNEYISPTTRSSALLPFASAQFGINGTERRFIVQPSEGLVDWIIPRYEPFEAMYFLASRAYSTESTSCSYRFFETLDDYYFVTDEYLIRTAIENNNVHQLTYSPFTSKDPLNIREQVVNLESFENVKRVDTADDIYSGGYYNIVLEMDLLRRRISSRVFDYSNDATFIDMYGRRRIENISVHSSDFISSTFTPNNARQFILYRDYTQAGDLPSELNGEQYLGEIVSRRVAYQHHLNNTVVSASIKGRLDLKPGDIVDVEIASMNTSSNRNYHQQLSGHYMIHTINQSVEHEILNTSMKLVKYDWSVGATNV